MVVLRARGVGVRHEELEQPRGDLVTKPLELVVGREVRCGTHRVVLIEFPNSEMKTVGLVTRTMRDADTGREYAAVYVPTTPNPTSGYLEIVPLERVTPTDWTMDQAMAFIISGGAIAPARFRFDAPPPVPSAPHDKE